MYSQKTLELKAIVENNVEIKSLLEKSIEQAKQINSDKKTNPAQTLEEYYKFITWAEKAMPWNFIDCNEISYLYDKIDQSLCYFYFINDQPLKELNGRGYYNNSLQYLEPYSRWLIDFNNAWGKYLDSEESWNEKYYQIATADASFGLKNDWYEDHKNWKSFNDFFARHLKSPEKRPVAEKENDNIIVSPADAQPQGIWRIDRFSNIIQHQGVAIKSATLNSVKMLIGEDSKYKDCFANGTLTHTYLGVNDYHRYHFPVSGTIKEARIIPGQNTAGCYITWDSKNKRYVYDASVPGWQSMETRGCIIVETKSADLVALLPVGMSQVCSVNFEDNIKKGAAIKKGDMMGKFLFGGSDFVMIFQARTNFQLDYSIYKDNEYKHILMGEKYGYFERYDSF